MMRLLGCDISPNHSGLVLVNEDLDILGVRFSHNMKTIVKKLTGRKVGGVKAKGYHVTTRKKTEHANDFQLRRHLDAYRWFREVINEFEPSHVAIEEYAFSQGTSAYTIGEITGLLKLIVYHTGIPLRLYSPNDIKMFATTKGNANKELVREAAFLKHGHDFKSFVVGSRDDVSFDLSDAFSISELLRMEALLRVGKIKLEDLDEKLIRVFNRATHKSKVNILGRGWIIKRD
jgi:Holliday junction resolvasome RuvABC endonuclease subunit